MKKDVWCALPWSHICIRPDNTLKPCCRYQFESGDAAQHSVALADVGVNAAHALNSEYLKKLRSDLLAGIPRVECKKCYVEEKNHRSSLRTNMAPVINLDPATLTNEFDSVRYLELSIDNICNLQCKMCDSKFSSRLIQRDRFLGNPVHRKLEPSYDQLSKLNLSKLTRIKLLGGEPFITPNFERFIDYIAQHVDVGQVYLDINTNATAIPSADIVYKLNQFGFLEFNISLDSYSPSNNYQRWGSDYLQVFSNVKQYEKLFDKKYIAYHSTISTLTANHLAHTVNILHDLHGYHISIDFVRSPELLCMLYAPDEYVDWVMESNQTNTLAYSVTKNFLKDAAYDPVTWQQFLDHTARLDQYYKTKLEDYNPELSKFLSKLNK